MEDWREEIWERANLFAAENGRTLIGQLGYGYDGSVFATVTTIGNQGIAI